MNDLIQQVNRQFEKKRLRNDAIAKNRKEEIYKSIPKIKAIDVEMAQIMQEIIKTVTESPQNAKHGAQQAAKIGKSLNAQKRRLLSENGFAEDYLERIFDCPICQDEGYLEDGTRCSCFRKALNDLAYRHSDLRAKLKKENFDTFKLELFSDQVLPDEEISQRENMTNIVETSMAFIENIKMPHVENLLFYGSPGQGKTFMCSCIAKALIDADYHVVYQTAYKMFDTIKDYKFANDLAARTRYQLLIDCDLLIVDDLGTELINTFTHTELFHIINARLLEQKKTLISTNLSPQELREHYGERIISRLIGHYRIIRFFGDDLRFS